MTTFSNRNNLPVFAVTQSLSRFTPRSILDFARAINLSSTLCLLLKMTRKPIHNCSWNSKMNSWTKQDCTPCRDLVVANHSSSFMTRCTPNHFVHGQFPVSGTANQSSKAISHTKPVPNRFLVGRVQLFCLSAALVNLKSSSTYNLSVDFLCNGYRFIATNPTYSIRSSSFSIAQIVLSGLVRPCSA